MNDFPKSWANTRADCFLSANINSFVNIPCHPQNLKIPLSSGKILGDSPTVSIIQEIKRAFFGRGEGSWFLTSWYRLGNQGSTSSHLMSREQSIAISYL